jgi:hypothetical protein
VVLRAFAGLLARTIREPASHSARHVLEQIVLAARIRVTTAPTFMLRRSAAKLEKSPRWQEADEPVVLLSDDDSEIRRAA